MPAATGCVSHPVNRPWTPEEYAILEEIQASGKPLGVVVKECLLPGRSKRAIRDHLAKLRQIGLLDSPLVYHSCKDSVEQVKDVAIPEPVPQRADQEPVAQHDASDGESDDDEEDSVKDTPTEPNDYMKQCMREEAEAREKSDARARQMWDNICHKNSTRMALADESTAEGSRIFASFPSAVDEDEESADEEIIRFGPDITSQANHIRSSPPSAYEGDIDEPKTPPAYSQNSLGEMIPPFPSSGRVRSPEPLQSSSPQNSVELDLDLHDVSVTGTRARDKKSSLYRMNESSQDYGCNALDVEPTTATENTENTQQRSTRYRFHPVRPKKRPSNYLASTESEQVLNETTASDNPVQTPTQKRRKATSTKASTQRVGDTGSDPVVVSSSPRSADTCTRRNNSKKRKSSNPHLEEQERYNRIARAAAEEALRCQEEADRAQKHKARKDMREFGLPVSPHASDSTVPDSEELESDDSD